MIPLEIRDLIDATVHDVIHGIYHHYPDGLESRCAIYAIVGAQFLSALTGRTFTPLCGAQWVDLQDGGRYCIYPSMPDVGAARALLEVRHYHCWLASDKPGAQEVVDFSVRHHAVACALLGIQPATLYDEPYAWADLPHMQVAAIPRHSVAYYAACLHVDRHLTALLHAFQAENRALFDTLTRDCLLRIHQGLEEFETLLRLEAQLQGAGPSVSPAR